MNRGAAFNMWLKDWFLPMLHFQKQRSCSTATGLSFISMCTTQLVVCFHKKCASGVHANLLFLILLEKFGFFSIFSSLGLLRYFELEIWIVFMLYLDVNNRLMAKG